MSDDISRGIFLIALGLTKKMAFADQFAKVANDYFANVAAHPGALAAWSGVFAFGLQIYFDFSGYTDMAIGMAKLFGFHFPINFRRPYLAASITDFWRRWHISLSSWLRDYLYIPLGGSRHGRWLTYRNLMLTMLLGGLWHGASWNFLIWGGYQGALLAIERALRGDRPPADDWNWTYPIRALLTFALALIGWVFFRAADLPQSFRCSGRCLPAGGGRVLLEPWHFGLAALALILAVGEEKSEWFERAARAPIPVYASRWPRCCSAWKSSASWTQPFPSSTSSSSAPMGGGVCTIESSKQITTKIARPDATIISDTPLLLTDSNCGSILLLPFFLGNSAAEHVTPRQNCPTAVSDVSELRAASIISDTVSER